MTRDPAHTRTDYRYAPIPEALLYDGDVSHLEIRIYGVLLRHGLDPSSCYPSHARIAELAHCSKRSVAAPLRHLEELGWISRHRRFSEGGDALSNGYTIHTRTGTGQRPPRADKSGGGRAEQREGPRSTTRLKRATNETTDVHLTEVAVGASDDAGGNHSPEPLTALRTIRRDVVA